MSVSLPCGSCGKAFELPAGKGRICVPCWNRLSNREAMLGAAGCSPRHFETATDVSRFCWASASGDTPRPGIPQWEGVSVTEGSWPMLTFFGPNGSGKSRLAAEVLHSRTLRAWQMARDAGRRLPRARWVTPSLLNLKSFDEVREELAAAASAEHLVIDDYGSEAGFVAELATSLVVSRWEGLYPLTIVTSHLEAWTLAQERARVFKRLEGHDAPMLRLQEVSR